MNPEISTESKVYLKNRQMSGLLLYLHRGLYEAGFKLPDHTFTASNGLKIRFDPSIKCIFQGGVLYLNHDIYACNQRGDVFIEMDDVESVETALIEFERPSAGKTMGGEKRPKHGGARLFYKRKKRDEFTLFIPALPDGPEHGSVFGATNGLIINFVNAYDDRIKADKYHVWIGVALRGKELILNDYIPDVGVLKKVTGAIQNFIDHN